MRARDLLQLTLVVDTADDLDEELFEILGELVSGAQTRQGRGDRGLGSHGGRHPRRHVADVSLVTGFIICQVKYKASEYSLCLAVTLTVGL